MLRIDRLKTRRVEKKLTQEEMALKLGITRQAYGNYETGKRDVDSVTLTKLVEILDADADYLLGITDAPRLSKKLDELASKEQAEFETFIKNPEHGIFFKDYLSAPEERREEMRQIFKILQEKEKGRKPGDRQGE